MVSEKYVGGVWDDVSITYYVLGTSQSPIVLHSHVRS